MWILGLLQGQLLNQMNRQTAFILATPNIKLHKQSIGTHVEVSTFLGPVQKE